MQGDGNFVVVNSSGGMVWMSATGSSGAFLALRDDGQIASLCHERQSALVECVRPFLTAGRGQASGIGPPLIPVLRCHDGLTKIAKTLACSSSCSSWSSCLRDGCRDSPGIWEMASCLLSRQLIEPDRRALPFAGGHDAKGGQRVDGLEQLVAASAIERAIDRHVCRAARA